MNIIKNTNSVLHNTAVRNGPIMYPIIHYTATDKSTAQNECAYFSRKTTTKASADFFVGPDGTIVQYNTDPAKRYTYAVGGKKYPGTKGGSMYGKITNRNSINIEMCCYKEGNVWKITDATYNATIELVRYIRQKYNIPAGRTYRHYDVTGKLCPNVEGFISPDTRWQSMRAAIDGTTAPTNRTTTQTNTTTAQPNRTTVDKASGTACDIKAKVIVDDLVIRTSPNGFSTGAHTGKGVFTISRYANGWGLLKSGAGWIYIDNKKYVTRLDQAAPVKAHRFNLAVDGSLGMASVRALQSWLGTTQDGIVSGQPYSDKKYLPACPSNWQFVSKGATGSNMIKKLQTHLGIGADGYCGPGTVKAIQRMVGVAQDGYLGPNTAKALQQYLNSL